MNSVTRSASIAPSEGKENKKMVIHIPAGSSVKLSQEVYLYMLM